MATKHIVNYRILGGKKTFRRNVVTKQDGTLQECSDEIKSILAAEYKCGPNHVTLFDGPAPPAPAKIKAKEIRDLNKKQLLDLVATNPVLQAAGDRIKTDGTVKELENSIIEVLGAEE